MQDMLDESAKLVRELEAMLVHDASLRARRRTWMTLGSLIFSLAAVLAGYFGLGLFEDGHPGAFNELAILLAAIGGYALGSIVQRESDRPGSVGAARLFALEELTRAREATLRMRSDMIEQQLHPARQD